MNWHDHIVSDPDVLVGKPTFRGTRLGVEMVLRKMAAGWSEADLVESYPRLTTEMIRAALAFAADASEDFGRPRHAA